MSLMSFIAKQFVDAIQWTEEDNDTLAWRFPMTDAEIQHGAMLTVRETQMALFVNEGRVADVFGPGLYKLTTQTLPVLTYLNHWDKLFESPFKSDVYFFSTRQKIDRKWGTPQAITVRDPEFGLVRLRAFGNYAYHLVDPKLFFTTLSGTHARYTTEDLEGQLRNTIVTQLADLFGEAGLPFVDMAAHQLELSSTLKEKLAPTFTGYGLALDNFAVQNISLPEELQAVLDKRISVQMMGGLQSYTQLQSAEAITLAARNEGGLAGLGAGAGVGLGIGQQVAASLAQALQPGTASNAHAAPAAPATPDEIIATIEKLHGLAVKGILTQAEFEAKKAELMKKLG